MRVYAGGTALLLTAAVAETWERRSDWPWSDNMLDPCFPDPCNEHGMCRRATDDPNEFTCRCINGWTGQSCDTPLDLCDPGPCQNDGICFTILEEEHCSCPGGYEGDNCEEEILQHDPCDGVKCTNQGTCVPVQGKPSCACLPAFAGPTCSEIQPYCSAYGFLELVTQISSISTDIASSCVYISTQIWAMYPSNNDDMPAICDCLQAMRLHLPSSWNLYATTCVIDEGITLDLAYKRYCPMECTQDDVDDMLEMLIDMNEDCEHFIRDRSSMPQYRRNPYKCACALSVASTFEEALDLLPCPFALHTAATGAVGWKHCHDREICEWITVYHEIEQNMFLQTDAHLDPSAAMKCLSMIEELGGIQPTGAAAYDLPEYLCPCYEGLFTRWPDGVDLFKCRPVVFFEVTLFEIMEKICSRTEFQDYQCTWNLTSAVFTLATREDDFKAAASCLQAMTLGDTAMTTTDKFDQLYCSCYASLKEAGLYSSYFDDCAAEIGWIVPTPSDYCENWLAENVPTARPIWSADDLRAVETNHYNGSNEDLLLFGHEKAYASDTVWMVSTIICSCLTLFLLLYNGWLYLGLRASYKQLNDAQASQTAATVR